MRIRGFDIQKEPGFRLSIGDFLLFGLSLAMWPLFASIEGIEHFAPLPMHAFLTFFVFCNICRIGTGCETIWVATLLVTVVVLTVTGSPIYPGVLAPTLSSMVCLLLWSARHGQWNGVGYRLVDEIQAKIRAREAGYPNPFVEIGRVARRLTSFRDWSMRHGDDPVAASGTFDLERFVVAQEAMYRTALAEINNGRKRTHWIWFIFPQVEGLGSSPISQHFSIRSIEEAKAYYAHPVLSARLEECAWALYTQSHLTAHEIFGSPDDLKVWSSMTLFAATTHNGSIFSKVLGTFYEGNSDMKTVAILERMAGR